MNGVPQKHDILTNRPLFAPHVMKAHNIAADLQALYLAAIPTLARKGWELMRTLPPKKSKLARIVFASIGQRLFLLLEDIHGSFQNKLDSGYFTTAALTRSLMETATALATLNRDTTGQTLDAFLTTAERDALRRRNRIAKLRSATNQDVARAAAAETLQADGIVATLQAIKAKTALPASSAQFPNMEQRCRTLGEHWQFMYEATYRDLCEAVHVAFMKIPHAPSLAFRAPDKGAALLYEHCRATNCAVEFWGSTIIECCPNHPDQKALTEFDDALGALLAQAAVVTDKFSPLTKSHSISF